MEITIPKLLADNLEEGESRIEVRDSLALACWLIASRCRKNGYVPISYDGFERVLRRNSIAARLNTLKKLKVIECDGKYSARAEKKKSLGYRLTRRAKESGAISYKLTRHRFTKRLSKQPIHHVRIDLQIHNLLADSLYKTDIDFEMARSISEVESGRNLLYWMSAVESIKLRAFHYKVDDYGRFHTNITNLPSKLRPALMIDGKALCEIDIACSQPTILAGLLSHLRGNHDVEQYVSLCESGELYEYLMEQTRTTCRATQKQALFHYVYGKVCNGHWDSEKMQRKNKVAQVFNRIFPTVARFIKDEKKAGYKSLAHKMQRLESNLVIVQVCGNLYEKHAGIHLLTIHDSILVLKQA